MFLFLFGGGLRDDTGHGMIVTTRLEDTGSVQFMIFTLDTPQEELPGHTLTFDKNLKST